jgi:DNA repair protein RadA/Sms
MLLATAVLTRRCDLKLLDQDVFVNVVGGLKVDEPAADLAMSMAIASSYCDTPFPADMVMIGEVGLSGELRSVSQTDLRLIEAAKLGFKRALVPDTRRPLTGVPKELQLVKAHTLYDALKATLNTYR